MQQGHEEDAGVQRPRTCLVGDHHGTCAAITFVAAFLGAHQMSGFAQPVE